MYSACNTSDTQLQALQKAGVFLPVSNIRGTPWCEHANRSWALHIQSCISIVISAEPIGNRCISLTFKWAQMSVLTISSVLISIRWSLERSKPVLHELFWRQAKNLCRCPCPSLRATSSPLTNGNQLQAAPSTAQALPSFCKSHHPLHSPHQLTSKLLAPANP